MKFKFTKKNIFNIYNLPAIILTILNIIIIVSDVTMMTWIAVMLNITAWISGTLLYKKKNFTSLIVIFPIIISFIISIRSYSNMVDPYFTHALFILFYFVSDLLIFYKKKNIKKQTKKVVTIVISSIILISTVFAIIDYNQIKDEKMPIFMILVDAKDEAEYVGLGYRFSLYNGVSHKLGIIQNSEYYFGSWFYLFGTSQNRGVDVINIVDKVETEGIVCAEALDYFYDDSEYVYYFSCLKKDQIVVEYSDKTTKTFTEAFLKDITIEDLDKYNIEYIKEKKQSTIGNPSTIKEASSEVILNVSNVNKEDGYLDYEIINNSENDTYEYGMAFFLEINKDGQWYELMPPVEVNFNLPLYYIEPKETIIDSIDIYGIYGTLEPGMYRLVKNVALNIEDTNYIIGSFEVK